MIKVVYFDVESATDYLNIYNGGNIIQTADKVKQKNAEIATQASAGVFAKLSWLPFLGGEASAEASAALSKGSASLVKTTLSNTVLTDFLEKIKADEKIRRFSDLELYAYKNSIAYFKMFTPYLTMTKSELTIDQGVTLDIARMDEAFSTAKGYYEMIAESKLRTHRYVFRFNLNAFRNNYGIADLTKMNLVLYGVKVGNVSESMLDINQEFKYETKQYNSVVDMVEDDDNEDLLEVYDIILTGIA